MKKRLVVDGVTYKLFISKKRIQKKIKLIARQIYEKHKDRHDQQIPLLLYVLTGGIFFGVDMSRELERLGFVHAVDTIGYKRYSDDEQGGEIKLISEPHADLTNRLVIIVEDVIDIGVTINAGYQYAIEKTKEVEVCVLGLKKSHEQLLFEPTYVGFTLGKRWIIGPGLDSKQRYRGLRAIYRKQKE